MPVIGLTGNFGMGKTTVLTLFKKLGSYTYNSDDFVHEILSHKSITRKISACLGSNVLIKTSEGIALNRKKIADIIFRDPEQRRAVEEIIHPGVLKRIKKVSRAVQKMDPDALIIVEVPLLFEAGYSGHFDKTIVVHSKLKTAVDRLRKKGFTDEDIKNRLRSQMPISRKKKMADYLIENNGDMKKTAASVKRLLHKLKNND